MGRDVKDLIQCWSWSYNSVWALESEREHHLRSHLVTLSASTADGTVLSPKTRGQYKCLIKEIEKERELSLEWTGEPN